MNKINRSVFLVGNTCSTLLFSPASGFTNINILTPQSSNLRQWVHEKIIKKTERMYHKKEPIYNLSKKLLDLSCIDQNINFGQSLHPKLMLSIAKVSSNLVSSGSQSNCEIMHSDSDGSSKFSGDASSSKKNSFITNDTTPFSANRSHLNQDNFSP
ncbi:hypothetical protein MXB_3062 [Myxobolus squamalis]|nr:hypothetical protein MXB_3062 [Myxobolus squamalis]